MFRAGDALLQKRYNDYPPRLPLLVFHGTEDKASMTKSYSER